MENKSPRRLVIEVSDKVHSQVKVKAALKNVTIKQWIMEAIIRQMKVDDQGNEKQ